MEDSFGSRFGENPPRQELTNWYGDGCRPHRDTTVHRRTKPSSTFYKSTLYMSKCCIFTVYWMIEDGAALLSADLLAYTRATRKYKAKCAQKARACKPELSFVAVRTFSDSVLRTQQLGRCAQDIVQASAARQLCSPTCPSMDRYGTFHNLGY